MVQMAGTGAGGRDAGLDVAAVDGLVREPLAGRAHRLGLDPATIVSPGPGAVIARRPDGTLLRLDVSMYRAADLER